MALKERISQHLGIPFVLLPEGKYVCQNGVVFTKEEYLSGIDLQSEVAKRKENGELYDYDYAKKYGILVKQAKIEQNTDDEEEFLSVEIPEEKKPKSVVILCIALLLTSFGSMYISTVHTANYLFAYVDKVSAILMSTVITIYCSSAFEIVILFFDKKRYILSFVFSLLWLLVIIFSMVTTVSIFYDNYNFSVVNLQESTKEVNSARAELSLLQKREKALTEEIKFKQQDITYRQAREYSTTAVRLELDELQKQLQQVLEQQQEIASKQPDALKQESEIKTRDNFFVFLSRWLHCNDEILEFIMSTLGAVFINLISPFSVCVVTSLLGGMKDNLEE